MKLIKMQTLLLQHQTHIVLKENEFINVAKHCLQIVAKNDILLTIGITPSRPDTGYMDIFNLLKNLLLLIKKQKRNFY